MHPQSQKGLDDYPSSDYENTMAQWLVGSDQVYYNVDKKNDTNDRNFGWKEERKGHFQNNEAEEASVYQPLNHATIGLINHDAEEDHVYQGLVKRATGLKNDAVKEDNEYQGLEERAIEEGELLLPIMIANSNYCFS